MYYEHDLLLKRVRIIGDEGCEDREMHGLSIYTILLISLKVVAQVHISICFASFRDMERRTIPKNGKIGRSRARWKLFILQALLLVLDDEESITNIAHSLNENRNEIWDALWRCKEQRRGIQGRIQEIVRNNKNWFNEYALNPKFISSPQWLSDFRIPYQVFKELCPGLGPSLMRSTTQLRI